MNTSTVKRFAEVTADAYVSHYTEGNRVMGDPVITYDNLTDRFGWQSSLTPLMDDEEIVFYLEDGIFGEDEGLTRESLTSYLRFEFPATIDKQSRLYGLLVAGSR